ncbi:glycosyltransferase family 39 protein [Pannus brasiliensis CCIBt3594]|uniref:Glycosyltransferase family 39 protein n=1 Tax=Pannus brasiliensis CCIBt3594 TaxID=1427578 RepID=A0AAW9QY00_9CHRO
MFTSRKTLVRCGLIFFIAVNILYFLYAAYFQYVWHDEVFVLLHLSGHTIDELTAVLFDGRIKSIGELKQFQGINLDRGFPDTLYSVYSGPNYDLPLYYSLLWILARIFGNSDLVLRGFSVLIWFGLLWAVYRLSFQLFKNQKIALLTAFLVFISPRFTGYALGIWEYGLYAFIATLSSFLFLKALESSHSREYRDWLLYGLSIVAGLYTHVFFIFIFLFHILYFFSNRDRFSELAKKYSSRIWLGSFLIYSIWLTRIFYRRVSVFSWSKGRWPWEKLIDRWITTFAGFFPDIPFIPTGVASFTNYALVSLILFSLFYLARKTDRKISSFALLLTGIPFLGLLILDIVLDFRYTVVGRFYLPSFIGISLAIAFLLSEGLQYYRIITSIALVLLTIFGLISRVPNPPEGNRFLGYGSNLPNAYPIINRSHKPLIIAESWLDGLPLIQVTDPNTEYLFWKPSIKISLPTLQTRFSDIFILTPSEKLKQEIERSDGRLKPTENTALWRVEK